MSDATCTHYDWREAPDVVARTAGCAECLDAGTSWSHLRICLTCGHVGCCDSSPHKHATRHFQDTGHAVMQTFETRETWGWCYRDEVYLRFPQRRYTREG